MDDFREDEEVASSEPQGDEIRSSPAETNGREITESCERQNQNTAAGDCVSKPELAEVTDESVGGVAQGAGGESEGEKGVGSGDGAVCEDVLGVCGEGEREGVGEGEGGVEPGKEGAVRIEEEGEEQLSQKVSQLMWSHYGYIWISKIPNQIPLYIVCMLPSNSGHCN